MKSSEGLYFQKLDHVRALAAYMVFIWHTIHPATVPYAATPPGLALLDEGHVGVSLFMVLSGYLFAKIIGDRTLDFPAFLWNRFIRLAPLLFVFLAAMWATWRGTPYAVTLTSLLQGFVLPTWPGGAWSIAIEFHFYLLFPFLLWSARHVGNWTLIAAVAVAIALRAAWFATHGEVQGLAYWTIFGRFDQFALGILAARLTTTAVQRRIACVVLFGGLLIFMEIFNRLGGFYGTAKSSLWIIDPTIEAAGFAALVLWYDQTRLTLPSFIGKPLAAIGAWSYSIYLLQFFMRLWVMVTFHVFYAPMSPELAILAATVAFAGMTLIGAVSYALIETPLLRFRIPYLRPHGSARAV